MARRSKFQREKDLQVLAERYLRGDFQAEIAKDLGVSQQTISNDLAEIRSRWQEKAVRDFDEAVAEELARIDRLEIEYWNAWVRSQEKEITIQQRKGEMAAGDVDYTTETEKQPVGDARFLDGVYKCIDRRCKLMGLDAPSRHDITTGGEQLIIEFVNDWRNPGEAAADEPEANGG